MYQVRDVAVRKYGSEAKLAEELEKRAAKRRGKAEAAGTMNSFLASRPPSASAPPITAAPPPTAAFSDDQRNTATTAAPYLPPLIAERVTVVRAPNENASSHRPKCVLYWMKVRVTGTSACCP
jgi:hypothetical protein